MALELRFSVDERQDRNVEIDGRYAENSERAFQLRGNPAELLQNRGGVVLIACGIVGEAWVEVALFDAARYLKRAGYIDRQRTEHVPIGRPEAHTDDANRRYCEIGEDSLYLLSL